MAFTNLPPLPQDIRSGFAVTTAAAGSLSGLTPSNTVKLFTAGLNGSIITSLSAVPRETAAANTLILFRSTDGGATKHQHLPKSAPAQTVNTTTPATPIDFKFTSANTLQLAPGEELYVAQTVANPTSGYDWQCQARDL